MQVQRLLAFLAERGVQPHGVADDSRHVQSGDVFLAYPGALADGRGFIADALARGACAVLWQPGGDFVWNPAWTAVNLPVESLRTLAGPLAHAVYQHPSENLSLIAITGTNGKTTVSQCLAKAYPRPCAVVGTLGAGFPGDLSETGFTTPEATVLMRYLADFRDQGAAACALEASSIGIEESRMNGLRVDVAVFTNLTRDHLDYHGTMEAYAAAKEKLFHWPRLRTAIINLDDEFGIHLMRESSAMRLIGYSCCEPRRDFPALVRAENMVATPFGQRFELVMPNGRCLVDTALPGQYNISNLLACAAVLYDAGVMPAEIARRLSELTPPLGRMESLGGTGEPLVIVDYAHTPDALEKALLALRPLAEARGGRLALVFGCGGDRDSGKRSEMGKVAQSLADAVCLTNDNPRHESPQAIVEAIQLGAPQARIELDRRLAIRSTIALAAEQDVILLAGKGHENYQEIAGERRVFSDQAEAAAALEARRAGREQTS